MMAFVILCNCHNAPKAPLAFLAQAANIQATQSARKQQAALTNGNNSSSSSSSTLIVDFQVMQIPCMWH